MIKRSDYEYTNSMKQDKSGLTIERIFDAPLEKVWRTWTDPKIVKNWWGPKDFTAPKIQIDFREGGKYLYEMRGKAGPDMPVRDFWSGGVFKKIVPMKKIVLTDYFTDDKGNKVSSTYYGMSADFPMEMELMVTFKGQGDRTKLTLNYPTRGKMPAADRKGMKEGWNQSLDKMAEALK